MTTNNSVFLDFAKLDLVALIDKSVLYQRRDNVNDTPGSVIMEYECPLDTSILHAFDTIRISMGWEEKRIREDLPGSIIAKFLSKEKSMTIAQAKFIVNAVAIIFNVNDDFWSDNDELAISTGSWRGRFFMSDKYTALINFESNDGVILEIIGIRDFIKSIASA